MAQTKKPKFNPASLTVEQQEAVVEYYIGLHPKYMIFAREEIKYDIWNAEKDGKSFDGWFPYLRKMQHPEEQIKAARIKNQKEINKPSVFIPNEPSVSKRE